ncbi:MAG: hypothetical protein R3C01_12105 [Planctomycetaceae bacterium]
MPVLGHALGDESSLGQFDGDEQRRRAVPFVIMGHRLPLATISSFRRDDHLVSVVRSSSVNTIPPATRIVLILSVQKIRRR